MNRQSIKNKVLRAFPIKRKEPPIFVIGFNKCGTNSVSAFLEAGGVPVIHWDGGELARAMKKRMEASEDPIADYPLYRGFSDMFHVTDTEVIEAHQFFDYFHRWYPDALFILNTRDVERWIASRLNHPAKNAKKSLQSRYASAEGVCESAVPDRWREAWDGHHASARSYFAGNPRFLEFNIETDDQEKLQQFMRENAIGDWSHDFSALNQNKMLACTKVDGQISHSGHQPPELAQL